MAESSPLNLIDYQFYLLPLVLLLLWRAQLLGRRIPAVLLLASLCCALVASFAPAVFVGGQKLLLAPLQDDFMGSKSALLLRRIERALTSLRSAVPGPVLDRGTAAASIDSAQRAQNYLEQYPAAEMVLWGNVRWINLSFRSQPPKLLSEFSILSMYPGAHYLRLMQSVPVIGYSFSPPEGGAVFAAHLAAAADRLQAERWLAGAAQSQETWTSFAHRAYAYWKLGNLELDQSLQREFEPAGLNCARENFEKALTFMRRGDNIELESAIYNNLAMTHLVNFLVYGDVQNLKQAYELLEFAQAAGKQPNLFKIKLDAPVQARLNAAALRALYQPRKKKKVRKLRDVN